MISASTNNLISLKQFDISLLNDSIVTSDLTNPYPLFDLPQTTNQYIEHVTLDLPINELNTLHDTIEVDTGPTKKILGWSYLWMFVCFLVIGILILMYLFKDQSIARWGLVVFVVVALFIAYYI